MNHSLYPMVYPMPRFWRLLKASSRKTKPETEDVGVNSNAIRRKTIKAQASRLGCPKTLVSTPPLRTDL